MAYVRRAIMADVAQLSHKIRKADRDEIKASDNVAPSEALLAPFHYKEAITFSVIGTDEEHVIAMFGSVPSPEKGYGVAWLLSSEELFNYKKEFIKQCPKWIKELGEPYTYIYNFVDVRNTKTLKWLKYLGFEQIETVNNYGYEKRPFILITKEM